MERYNFTPDQRTTMESMKVPFAVYQFIDNRVTTLILSDGFMETFGYTSRETAYYDMDNDMYGAVHDDDKARIANAAYKFATEGGEYEVIYRSRIRNSEIYKIIHAYGKHVYQDDVRLAYIWYISEGIFNNDESEAKGHKLNAILNNALHEESIIKAGYYDYLTGLPSMSYFFELARAAKDNYLEKGERPVLLYFDLIGMKYFNHSFGFAKGDEYLREFAKLLVEFFSNESCSHFGQDHFGAFTTYEGVEELLQKLFKRCESLNDGNYLPIRVGIYLHDEDDAPVGSACDRAKLACDSLVGVYSSAYKYYEKWMSEATERAQYIRENIDKAIAEGWIHVYYQPIVRAINGRICDEEALARWIDPEKGFLSPAEFIPYLEDSSLIYKLDLCVLDQVLKKLSNQRRLGMILLPHSINLSRSDFDACDIVEEVRRRVDAHDIPHEMITIEVTESMIGQDFDFMKQQIERIRELGFPVWMDDFGSGYSSLDVLQSIKFDLIKFDMSFMRKLDEGEEGKIVLTELMRMATALNLDTVCEGVETAEQVKFLQEIGCSKMQGYYFGKPEPIEALKAKFNNEEQTPYEEPKETAYYDAIGRVNLYDLSVIFNEEDGSMETFFNTIPMAIMEIRGDKVRFIRSNQSYRDFLRRYFDLKVNDTKTEFMVPTSGDGSAFMEVVKKNSANGNRTFFDEQLPDGSLVHTFVRKIADNPLNKTSAVAVAILSIRQPDEGMTYAAIARALASDFYNIYYVDLKSDKFIEYSSPIGEEKLAVERHGDNFFEASVQDSDRIYKDDKEVFYAAFNKQNIIRELDEQGVFTATYRLMDTCKPMYVNMKITRMLPDRDHIIIGISIIDSQMKQKELLESIRRERELLTRTMALSDDYLSLYTVDPVSGNYYELNTTKEYDSLGFEREGKDFFAKGISDGKKTVHPDDLTKYLEEFDKDKIMKQLEEKGSFNMSYRLVINGEPKSVSLKIALFKDNEGQKLIAGVRAWRERK